MGFQPTKTALQPTKMGTKKHEKLVCIANNRSAYKQTALISAAIPISCWVALGNDQVRLFGLTNLLSAISCRKKTIESSGNDQSRS